MAGLFTHPCVRPAPASQGRDSDRDASPSMVSLRPRLHIHVQSFGRFDEILYLIEKTSDLTLPDFGRSPLQSVATSMSQMALEYQHINHTDPGGHLGGDRRRAASRRLTFLRPSAQPEYNS
jgi:hypothetical protein